MGTEDRETTDIVYVPGVVIFGYSDGSEFEILKRDTLYSKQRSEEYVSQMLRLCAIRGCDEIIIESTGLQISGTYFREAFCNAASDVFGKFRKVSFAQCTPDVAEDLQKIFFA